MAQDRPRIIFFGFFEKFETLFSKICAHSERYRNLLAGIFEILTFMEISRFHCHWSKADYHADPIPSFRFWSGHKVKNNSCKIETGFLCGDGARVIRFLARVIQQLGFGLRKVKPTSTTATSGAAPSALRSALDSSIQAYAQTLVWPRRDVPMRALRGIFSNKASEPSTRAAALCVLSHDTYPRKTRAGCAAFLVL